MCVLTGFFKVWPWWPLRHFEKPQLFHLNAKMVMKRRFGAFWWWLCSEVSLHFERSFRSPINTVYFHHNWQTYIGMQYVRNRVFLQYNTENKLASCTIKWFNLPLRVSELLGDCFFSVRFVDVAYTFSLTNENIKAWSLMTAFLSTAFT